MERSIDELIELLNDKDDFVVEDAVGELELRAEEAVDPLIEALSHRKKQIRLMQQLCLVQSMIQKQFRL